MQALTQPSRPPRRPANMTASRPVILRAAAERDIGFPGAKVTHLLAGIQLDEDIRMPLAKARQQRDDEAERVNLFRRDADGPAELARVSRGALGERGDGGLHLPGACEQVLAGRRERVAGLPFLEQGKAERLFQRGNSPGDRRLADAQLAAGGERASLARNGEEIAKIVPVQHHAYSANMQNDSTTSLLPRHEKWD